MPGRPKVKLITGHFDLSDDRRCNYYLGGKITHSRASGVLDRSVLKVAADMCRPLKQAVHEGLDT